MMTIKVYRVLADGTREPVSHEQVTKPLDVPVGRGFPPCSCPRCREQDGLHVSERVSS